MGRWFKNRKFI